MKDDLYICEKQWETHAEVVCGARIKSRLYRPRVYKVICMFLALVAEPGWYVMMTVTWEPHWEGKMSGRNGTKEVTGKATGAAPTAQEKGHWRRGTREGGQRVGARLRTGL